MAQPPLIMANISFKASDCTRCQCVVTNGTALQEQTVSSHVLFMKRGQNERRGERQRAPKT